MAYLVWARCSTGSVSLSVRPSTPKNVVRRFRVAAASFTRRSHLVVVKVGLRGHGTSDGPRKSLEEVYQDVQPPELGCRHKEGLSVPDSEDDFQSAAAQKTTSKGGEEGDVELQARLLLLLVPIMWATYAPSTRFIYAQPLALAPSVLNFARKLCSLVFFFYLLPLGGLKTSEEDGNDGPQSVGRLATLGGLSPDRTAAVELGLWSFAGTAFQTIGLQSTTATRAAFLLQTVTILVPLLAALSGGRVSSTMWGAATMALLGVSLMTLSRGEASVEDILRSVWSADSGHTGVAISLGDIAVLGSAAFYALSTVRLSFHATQLGVVRLTGNVMVVSSIFSAGWVLLDVVRALLDGPGLLGWEGLGNSSVIAAIAFSAVVPGTLASLAQTYGQKTVPASEAQVYYSFHPLWSAALGSILLDERMSSLGWVAGMLVLVAALLASFDTHKGRDGPVSQ